MRFARLHQHHTFCHLVFLLHALAILRRASLTHILLARSVGRLAIEDETDFVTNTCNGGEVPFATCKRRVEEHKGGYDSATDSVPYDSQQHNEPKAEL